MTVGGAAGYDGEPMQNRHHSGHAEGYGGEQERGGERINDNEKYVASQVA
jgi:hypothetical protein